ncbi:hypothetical protein GRI75_07575 [Altererythrobacter soli]|uniref:Uncharacterized protein n=1 Tax=Croceibacterium soli TaxID=1739690 RepID=A0A6I4URI3_9SPHN|nr:hypothetical protein [Croceibacterium soli]MXP41502.1 hypothetical protein [Croceibacterium soli]
MRTLIFASIGALSLIATPAIAQTTVGGGISASTPHGSVAGGASAGTADKQDGKRNRAERRRDRDHRDHDQQRANSATTYGSGTVYTDRRTATGGVTAGASASGTSTQSASTAIDAYGRTTREGGEAEVYGESDARSGR